MLIFLPTILLLGLATALGAVRFFRPRSRFIWLGALAAALGTWLVILIWRFELPLSLDFSGWGAMMALPAGLEYSVDGLGWVAAWSLASMLLAGLIIGAAEPDFQPSVGWTLPLVFGATALLALSAANALSLVLVWAALDLAEAGLALAGGWDRAANRRVVPMFAVRLAALVMAVLAQVLGGANPETDTYALLMLAAVLVRILVQWQPASEEPPAHLRGGIGTTLQLSSAVATLGVLPRLHLTGGGWLYAGMLLLLSATIALYAGWMWLRSQNLRVAFPHALAGISALAAGSSLLRNPPGAAAWTAALALACGVLFLSEGRKTNLSLLGLVGAWSLSALPFSLTGAGWPSQFGVEQWALPAFILAQAFLLAGFLQSVARPLPGGAVQDQITSLRAVRHLGIVFIVGIQVLLGLWGWQGSAVWQALIPGTAASVVGLILFAGGSRLGLVGGASARALQGAAERSLTLARDLAVGVYSISERLVASVTSLLEGQAGIMWGLLLLALFVSLIVGGNP